MDLIQVVLIHLDAWSISGTGTCSLVCIDCGVGTGGISSFLYEQIFKKKNYSPITIATFNPISYIILSGNFRRNIFHS